MIDDAFRAELAQQEQRTANLVLAKHRHQRQQIAKFAELTNGKLAYLQPQAEVRKLLGLPTKILLYQGARAVLRGSCDRWRYSSFEIQFHDGLAIEIEATEASAQ